MINKVSDHMSKPYDIIFNNRKQETMKYQNIRAIYRQEMIHQLFDLILTGKWNETT